MTHLATPHGPVRPKWHGEPPAGAVFVCYGRLFDFNTPENCRMVHIWLAPRGFGYED